MSILLVVLFATHICAFVHLKVDLPIEERIYGGEDAGEHEFPTQVYFFASQYETNYANCGGTILNEWFILTAGHCLYEISDSARVSRVGVGSANLKAGRIFKVDKFIIHDGYHGGHKHDIALIKLAEPLVLDGVTVKAAVLPEQDEEPTSSNATVIGAGAIDIFGTSATKLQKMTTQLVECNRGRLHAGEELLCIAQGPQKGVCHGDSGGPLFVDGKVFGELHGFITDVCFKHIVTVVYTKVSVYRSWIDFKMKTE